MLQFTSFGGTCERVLLAGGAEGEATAFCGGVLAAAAAATMVVGLCSTACSGIAPPLMMTAYRGSQMRDESATAPGVAAAIGHRATVICNPALQRTPLERSCSLQDSIHTMK